MELNINIKTHSNCKCLIEIEDKSKYLSENSEISYNNYRKSDVKTLTILYLNSLKDPFIQTSTFDSIISIEFDGWFTVNYLVIPTKEWVDTNIKINKTEMGMYDLIYYTDDNKIYQLESVEGTPKLVSFEDVLDNSQLINLKTTVSITLKQYISVCFLQKCYINLCLLIFEGRGFSQCSNNIDKELIYKRDLIWMALNVIKYMGECNQLYEAERIIELLHSCNGVCSNKKIISNGCGCS